MYYYYSVWWTPCNSVFFYRLPSSPHENSGSDFSKPVSHNATSTDVWTIGQLLSLMTTQHTQHNRRMVALSRRKLENKTGILFRHIICAGHLVLDLATSERDNLHAICLTCHCLLLTVPTGTRKHMIYLRLISLQ